MRTPQVAAMPRLITGIRTVLCLATWVGCESTSPSSLVEYSLTGTVYDTARRPLAEVHIGVAAGSRVGVSAVSDGAGHYELPGTFTGAQVLRAEKPGFAPVTILHHSSVSGPSRRDIYLTNPETADVSGDWTVTLIANSSCTEIPEAIRTRSYRGSIRLENYPPHHFDSKLQSDALTSNWSNNISVSVSGTDARFEIEAWDWGLGIVEDLGQSRSLFIWGEGGGLAGHSTLVGALTGGFEYTDYSGQAPVGVIKCKSFQLEAVRR